VPSAKRARQRAAKQARLAEEQRKKRNRQVRRRGAIVAGLVVIAVVIAIAISSGGSHKVKAATTASRHHVTSSGSASSSSTSSSSSSSGSSSSSTSSVAAAQAAADRAAVAAGCPSNPHAPLHKPSFSSPPPMTIDTSATYTATVKTDVGTFTMTLDPAEAPIAVNSFVFLANKGFFNCIIFHRVIPGFVDQTGDPTGTGTGGPGYEFTEHGPPPAANSAQQYPLGSVAMANSSPQGDTDPSTNGSQFFIVTGPSGESLPPDYVLFGKVTSGMSVVEAINKDGSPSGTPTVIHRMLDVTVTQS
jgi:cyclophilin family peptidyl-prolyl cis-trans isomerase